ncbi:MAG: hypothetical protein ACK58L_13165 [Planctomycetota bacterium]
MLRWFLPRQVSLQVLPAPVAFRATVVRPLIPEWPGILLAARQGIPGKKRLPAPVQ